ncbi:MAG: hypothetical protein AAF982_07885, partial [Pseudomonadota bacterium]
RGHKGLAPTGGSIPCRRFIMDFVKPDVAVVTAHGRKVLQSNGDERLIDTLKRNGIPWSATSIYGLRRDEGQPQLLSSLGTRLSELGAYRELLIYFNRNVNPFLFSIDDFNTVGPEHEGDHCTEFIYQVMDNNVGRTSTTIAKMSPQDCRNLNADRVRDVVRDHVEPDATVVVGVSGGGDSNALLYGLSKMVEHHGISVRPIIVKGIPDWDAGVPRARELCETYGFDLVVLEEADIREMMGVPNDGVTLIDRFEREFKGDDFEFLGTLIIRIALSKHAEKIGASYICTGLNLEDVVCEQLFRISNGMKPSGIPSRQIGDKTLIMPLWMCPKRIIDGCFPKHSLDNYDARYPSFSLGRNLYYSVVYSIQSSFPNFVETMAKGLSKVAEENPVEYSLDVGLDVHVERLVPMGLRQRFLNMLRGRID